MLVTGTVNYMRIAFRVDVSLKNDNGGHRCPLCLSESDFNGRRHTCQVYVFTITYRNWGQ